MYLVLGSRSERGGARRAPTKRVFFTMGEAQKEGKCGTISVYAPVDAFFSSIEMKFRWIKFTVSNDAKLLVLKLIAYSSRSWLC